MNPVLPIKERPEMPKTETVVEIPVEETSHVNKRQIAAVATATTATVVLTVVANVLIGRISAVVQNRINPPAKTEEKE
jgi:hypothetical protein